MLNTKGIKGHDLQLKRISHLFNSKEIPNTILFLGNSGTGKRKIGNVFLTAMFCTGAPKPCFNCSHCRQISVNTFPDYIEISPDEKGVIPIGGADKKETGSIRWLIDRISRKPLSGRYVILIDGIDKITEEGQNALLKTIEEPSENIYFVLISSSRSDILPTILSRCFEIKFSPMPPLLIEEFLISNGCSKENSDFISRISGGSFEMAGYLLDEKIISNILNDCKNISSAIKGDNANLNLLKSFDKIDFQIQIDIILNIFRLNLLLLYSINTEIDVTTQKMDGDLSPPPPQAGEGTIFPPLFEKLQINKDADGCYRIFYDSIFINDIDVVKNLIKIFLALKKGRKHNLNIDYSLKGMIYNIVNDYNFNMPFLKSNI